MDRISATGADRAARDRGGPLFFFQAEDGIRDPHVTGVQTCALPIFAPEALFWFRWGALSTVVTGLILAGFNQYLFNALKLGIGDGNHKFTAIGFGMWMGLIMAYNVWFIIWPNQQKALGMVNATADEKKAAGRTAMLFSRTNTMLSIPMLYAMTSTHFY